MDRSILRGFVSRAAAVSATATIVVSVASCAPNAQPSNASYCATMPDAVGLYVGNPVTQMGYPIGKISSITPGSTDVRVDFSVTDSRKLPNDVRAIIRSPSILADRSLELVGNYGGGPQLEAASCISRERSMSPKTISEVIGSAHTFINSINLNTSTNIGDTVRQVDELLHDNGARAGQLVADTSALLDSPDQAVSDIGSIIQNLATVLRYCDRTY